MHPSKVANPTSPPLGAHGAKHAPRQCAVCVCVCVCCVCAVLCVCCGCVCVRGCNPVYRTCNLITVTRLSCGASSRGGGWCAWAWCQCRTTRTSAAPSRRSPRRSCTPCPSMAKAYLRPNPSQLQSRASAAWAPQCSPGASPLRVRPQTPSFFTACDHPGAQRCRGAAPRRAAWAVGARGQPRHQGRGARLGRRRADGSEAHSWLGVKEGRLFL